jgi:hypothetical protein
VQTHDSSVILLWSANQKIVETEFILIPLTHIQMTAPSYGLKGEINTNNTNPVIIIFVIVVMLLIIFTKLDVFTSINNFLIRKITNQF